MSKRDVNSVLILRFSSLGDIVMTTAMIRCLRKAYPNARIDMAVRDDFKDVISENPHLTNKYYLNRKGGLKALWSFKNAINQNGYDLIYDAHRSLRTLFLMPLLRAKYKAYFKKHYLRRNLSLLLKLPLIKNSPRFLERYIEPLNRFGVLYDGKGPEMHIAPEVLARTDSVFPFPPSHKTIGLIPSAQWPGKRWPIAYFRKLLERIVHETSDNVIVFGGPSDLFCKEICRGFSTSRVFDAQGSFSISESAALVKRCALVVANDTGLMHIADALGVPSVLFLGPTSGDLGCLPFQPKTIVLEKKLWCRPCSKNGQAPCIRRERFCLTQITPDDAYHAVRSL